MDKSMSAVLDLFVTCLVILIVEVQYCTVPSCNPVAS